ncbi:phospholipase D-like domain-containing protein [Phaeobacter sp. 22II1-1F12B]|uniref:phospholipase D family protein n=1 Tax=Phaeobacter sp. 22II1-1F12B TaxID=1317111 RepID=UPI000B51FBC2|nr:phospholipase D-like domain-containing protein [Phaeobacter sp. 22II1-1F12B]OWU79104.1 hypothetical protein ATO1_13555 [Phaeobacter sp. 22II1-1F12B]
MRPVPQSATSRDFQVYITAGEAYPEFERMFLNAREKITLAFRIFDPWTTLHSPEALEIGENWMDLIAHTLSRGVAIDLTISDFDPVLRPELHRGTWASVRAIAAAGELSTRPELLRVHASMHPARVGTLTSIALWPRTYLEIRKTAAEINHSKHVHIDRFMSEVPFLRRNLRKIRNKLGARLLPVPFLVPVTHHQKLAVFDRDLLYIGGLDLNDRRYDTPAHGRAADETWHDVQVSLKGPEVADAVKHLETFEDVTLRRTDPPKLPNLLRTLSRKPKLNLFRLSPSVCVTELSDYHHAAVGRSEKLIYLESQFFRDVKLARTLARAAKNDPALKVILILPAAPDDVAFEHSSSGDARYGEYLQAKSVKILREAFGERVFIGSPAQRRSSSDPDRSQIYGAPIIYVHAKVSIFDHREAVVSSANLNGRSLKWDTEAGVKISDADEIAHLKKKCFEHWLVEDVNDAFYDPEQAVEAWRNRARENARAKPEDRKGFLVPYTSAPARRFGHSLPGIPEEMV